MPSMYLIPIPRRKNARCTRNHVDIQSECYMLFVINSNPQGGKALQVTVPCNLEPDWL